MWFLEDHQIQNNQEPTVTLFYAVIFRAGETKLAVKYIKTHKHQNNMAAMEAAYQK